MASLNPPHSMRTLLLVFLCIAASTNALADLRTGLAAHLPLRTDLRDASAYAHPVQVAGRVGLRDGAAWFEGKGDWLELPHIGLNDRPYSVAMWLRPTGEVPTYGLVQQWDRSVTGHIFHLMIRDGLRPWLGHYVNDLVSPLSLKAGGDWQHLCFQYTGTHQQIWINGRLICERKAEAYKGTEGLTCVGRNPDWNNVPGSDYQGAMSDFRLYQRALGLDEITTLSTQVPAGGAEKPPRVAPVAQAPGAVAPAGAGDSPIFSIDGASLVLRGVPGEEYVVEDSPDLIKWEVLATLTLPESGEIKFVDEDAEKYQQRFYRIRYRVP